MLRTILLLLFICLPTKAFLQDVLPVINANNEIAQLIDGKNGTPSNWYLSPDARPDVYELNRAQRPQWVSLVTDIDEIKVKLMPGEQFDFVVLLNGKDSCYNRFVHRAPILKYKDQAEITQDTIPFSITENNDVKVQAILNQKDTVQLNYDSGGTRFKLTKEALINKTDLLSNGKDFSQLPKSNSVQLGSLVWEDLPIIPVDRVGQEMDGKFCWDFFDGRILEIDYEKNYFVVHSGISKNLRASLRGYKKYKLEFNGPYFFINGKLKVNGKVYKNKFALEGSFQRSMLLDSVLMQEQSFPKDLPVINSTKLMDGAGRVYITEIVNIETLKLGGLAPENIPARLLTTRNPAGFNTHMLGNDFLKRFNAVLDLQNDVIYLKPNSLMDLPYSDAG